MDPSLIVRLHELFLQNGPSLVANKFMPSKPRPRRARKASFTSEAPSGLLIPWRAEPSDRLRRT
jgi:hypothetical protein